MGLFICFLDQHIFILISEKFYYELLHVKQLPLIPWLQSYVAFTKQTYPCGIIDLHLSQKFPINAEIAEPPSFVVDDTVAFAGDWNQAWEQAVFRALEGSQQISSDGVDKARALCRGVTPMARLVGRVSHTHWPSPARQPHLVTHQICWKKTEKERGTLTSAQQEGFNSILQLANNTQWRPTISLSKNLVFSFTR